MGQIFRKLGLAIQNKYKPWRAKVGMEGGLKGALRGIVPTCPIVVSFCVLTGEDVAQCALVHVVGQTSVKSGKSGYFCFHARNPGKYPRQQWRTIPFRKEHIAPNFALPPIVDRKKNDFGLSNPHVAWP